MKRILIDGRFIGVGESMTRYCLEIVKGILELDRENEYTLLVRPQGASQISNLKSQNYGNLIFKVLDIPHYSLAEQTELLKYLNSEQYDLVHFIQFNHPLRYRGKFVVTVHDLTLLGHLHNQPYYQNLAFGMVMKSAVRNSSKIISVSETSKQEIVEYYKADPAKIAVTHLAVDSGAYNPKVKTKNQEIKAFKKKYQIAGEYFLYTGMWKKHKNLIRLLEAYEIFVEEHCKHTEGQPEGSPLGRPNTAAEQNNRETEGLKDNLTIQQFNNEFPQLVLVGKIDKEEPEIINLVDKINEMSKSECRNPNEMLNDKSCKSTEGQPEGSPLGRPNMAAEQKNGETEELKCNLAIQQFNNIGEKPEEGLNSIVCTGYIQEEELPLAYAGALAYVMPSLSEGFGLPPLEAMACGTPVLSSNVSAMPEILGEAPLYFDPYDVADMAEKMNLVASDEKMRADLAARGLEQVKKYDWAKTAKQTLEVYEGILKN